MVEQDAPALFDPDLLTPLDQEILGSMEKAVSTFPGHRLAKAFECDRFEVCFVS